MKGLLIFIIVNSSLPSALRWGVNRKVFFGLGQSVWKRLLPSEASRMGTAGTREGRKAKENLQNEVRASESAASSSKIPSFRRQHGRDWFLFYCFAYNPLRA